eukprot:CAMPEP_0171080874 /NCGR_PEP_ID=MMETSP0766_2-20121228/16152_1 /TAXON_ID=439317 /ORGANISM="Gambierdiscus australes, Strain CAWD 149" /LENGTH=79 /DNA_ID=CAMNT_0011538151 /DNA_START=1 /DNA_END=237 /DNA_ORIENTATION=-
MLMRLEDAHDKPGNKLGKLGARAWHVEGAKERGAETVSTAVTTGACFQIMRAIAKSIAGLEACTAYKVWGADCHEALLR